MTKEPGQPPKAVNIIRPNTNYGLLHNTTSTSSSGSSNSGSLIYSQQQHQQQHKRNGTSSTNSSVLSSNRKPRVNSTAKIVEKPVLNLYHPPTRKPSYDRSNSSSIISTSTANHSSRPPIEIYKPQQQQQQHHFPPVQHQAQRMTKSLTAPSLTSNSESFNNANNHTSSNSRPISPFHGRPNHRSVLGPIVTPVAATTTTNQSPTAIADHSEYNNRSLFEGINKIVHEEQPGQQDTIVNDDVENDIEDDDDDNSEEEEIETIEEEEEEEEEEPVINEARVNRKIADLELSINSLLTVNAMLEATVRKQASQLNQMKQKMLSGESVDKILDEVTIIDVVEDHHSGQADEEEEDWDKDVLFQRLRKITEYMIEQGQKSIDYEYKILGRVLSNYEQNDDDDDDEDDDEEEGEEEEEEDDNDTIPDNTAAALSLHQQSLLPAKSKSDTLSPKSTIPSPSSIPLPTTHIINRIPKSKKRLL